MTLLSHLIVATYTTGAEWANLQAAMQQHQQEVVFVRPQRPPAPVQNAWPNVANDLLVQQYQNRAAWPVFAAGDRIPRNQVGPVPVLGLRLV